MLRPQDVMVLGWIALQGNAAWRYIDLAQQLALSASESHGATARLGAAGLLRPAGPARLPHSFGEPLHAASPGVRVQPALEFLLHGVPYAFYAERGPVTSGMLTGVAAKPLNAFFTLGEEIPVWPKPVTPRARAMQPE